MKKIKLNLLDILNKAIIFGSIAFLGLGIKDCVNNRDIFNIYKPLEQKFQKREIYGVITQISQKKANFYALSNEETFFELIKIKDLQDNKVYNLVYPNASSYSANDTIRKIYAIAPFGRAGIVSSGYPRTVEIVPPSEWPFWRVWDPGTWLFGIETDGVIIKN